jgi:hypothetical protein
LTRGIEDAERPLGLKERFGLRSASLGLRLSGFGLHSGEFRPDKSTPQDDPTSRSRSSLKGVEVNKK